MTYFNELDPFAAEWIGNLFPEATVDVRSIKDVTANDVQRFERCHFFGGIGGWELALRLAGWPVGSPVWTGSCPCQPFSDAGKGNGAIDPRHLWPEFGALIAECRPPVIFGEQVASKVGREWLDGISLDLEELGYAVGSADLCAPCAGSPHIRQRLFWVAHRDSERLKGWQEPNSKPKRSEQQTPRRIDVSGRGGFDRLADSASLSGPQYEYESRRGSRRTTGPENCPECGGDIIRLANSIGGKLQGIESSTFPTRPADAEQIEPSCDVVGIPDTNRARLDADERSDKRERSCPCSGSRELDSSRLVHSDCSRLRPESHSDIESTRQRCNAIACRDGKTRRIPVPESGVFPLAYGLSRGLGQGRTKAERLVIRSARTNRVGRLKGYGNAIVPQVAAVFIRAFMEVIE